jgi:hypothetical protein
MIKVYANSLLAVLNSRALLGSNSRDGDVLDSSELSTSFHVTRHQDNIRSQVSILFLVLSCYLTQERKGPNTGAVSMVADVICKPHVA